MDFELCLFCVEPIFIRAAIDAGIPSIIVDWEYMGKENRQSSYNTQINHHTVEDLQIVRKAADANVICRINPLGEHSAWEITQAIHCGADEILVPMIKTLEEIQWIFDLVKGRAGIGILIETQAALAITSSLASLPLRRIYLGLNDLAIEKQNHNIFLPIAEGIVERVRKSLITPFGFAGLTLPDHGFPIPCSLLMGELMRLDCEFTFLRRSFMQDIRGKNLFYEIDRMYAALEICKQRAPLQIDKDREDLREKIESLDLCLI